MQLYVASHLSHIIHPPKPEFSTHRSAEVVPLDVEAVQSLLVIVSMSRSEANAFRETRATKKIFNLKKRAKIQSPSSGIHPALLTATD